VEHGQRVASCDTSLVVAAVLIAGEDDEMFMPQRYAKDNRTAHLTARSDICSLRN